MNEKRLAEAWPHIRSAVEILLYGHELQAEPASAPIPTEHAKFDREELILVRDIREILNDADPAEPSPNNVCVSSDKIPGGVRWGTYSQIARELGISPCAVRKVAIGQSVSKRVSDALVRHGVNVTHRVVKIERVA